MAKTVVGLDAAVPFEILRHCATFLALRDIASLARCSRRCCEVADEDWTWTLLLRRDHSSRCIGALAEHEGRRVKEVFEMVHTGKYVERRFEDRPLPQRVAIIVGSIVLSPVLLVYLSPKIASGVYRNAIVPTIASLKALESQPVSEAKVQPRRRLTFAEEATLTAHLDSTPTNEDDIPFRERPLWQKIIIVIISFFLLPVILWKVRKRVARVVLRSIKTYLVFPARRFIMRIALYLRRVGRTVYTKMCMIARYLRTEALRCARWIAGIVQPILISLRDNGALFAKRTAKKISVVASAAFDAAVKVEDSVVTWAEARSCDLWKWYKRCQTGKFKKRLLALKASVLGHAARVKFGAVSLSRRVGSWLAYYVVAPSRNCLNAGQAAFHRAALAVANTAIKLAAALRGFVRDRIVSPVIAAGLKTRRAFTIMAAYVYSRVFVPCGRSVKRVTLAVFGGVRASGVSVYNRLLLPIASGVTRGVTSVARAIQLTGRFLFDFVVCPVGRLIKASTVFIVRSVRLTGAFLYSRVLQPIGRALIVAGATTGRTIVGGANLAHRTVAVPVFRGVEWSARMAMRVVQTTSHALYKKGLVPAGRAVRQLALQLVLLAKAAQRSVVVPCILATKQAVSALRRNVTSVMMTLRQGIQSLLKALASFVGALVRAVREFLQSIARKVGGK